MNFFSNLNNNNYNRSAEIWFYDRYGVPEILFLLDNRFVDKQGNNLGYAENDKIYNYHGRHCGWIENGVIRDVDGYCVAFSDGADDFPTPIFPIPRIPPIPRYPRIPPIPRIPQIPRIPPVKKFAWSSATPVKLFE